MAKKNLILVSVSGGICSSCTGLRASKKNPGGEKSVPDRISTKVKNLSLKSSLNLGEIHTGCGEKSVFPTTFCTHKLIPP